MGGGGGGVLYDCYLLIIFIFSELTQIVADVIADPTLPRTHEHQCPRYNTNQSIKVFIQVSGYPN